MEDRSFSIFSPADFCRLTSGLQIAQCMTRGHATSPESSDVSMLRQLEDLVVSDAHSCSCCAAQFPNSSAQRAHFKLDWHRYNIKRQLAGLSTIREEVFDSLADKDDIESISGSESESEAESEVKESASKDSTDKSPSVSAVTRHAKVFFRNTDGLVISMYRCLLFPNKETPETDDEIVSFAKDVCKQDTWAIIMLGGGHFAAAIFKGTDPVVHKTFHCYTVRAKQGGSQSARDNRGAGHPKSAGASLRRYNEQALVQHVQDLISTWIEHLSCCNLVFYRAVGPNNRSVLFGGKAPPLNKNDTRLRTIPFPTRRATYSEVKRVHSILSTIEVHGSEEDFQSKFPPPPPRKFGALKEESLIFTPGNGACGAESSVSPRRSKVKGRNTVDRAKSRPSPQRPLPTSIVSSESEAVSGSEIEICYENVTLSLEENIQEYGQSMQSDRKCKKKKQKPKEKVEVAKLEDSRTKEEIQRDEQMKQLEEDRKKKIMEKKARKAAVAALRKQQEEEEACQNPTLVFQRQLLSAVQSGDIKQLNYILSSESLSKLPGELPGGLEQSLNLPLVESNTALHIAAKAGHTDMISVLLLAGAHPSTWNKKSQPAYVVASNKDTRKAFREFFVEHPDMFDYEGSQIPTPLTEEQEQEIAEKKAALKKAKRDKEKEKRKAQVADRMENEEKLRFLSLSDREKRALAAERRLLAAQAQGRMDVKSTVLARCFLCATDITGHVPFEYEQFRFCSMDCLKAHRLKTKNSVEHNK